MKSLWTECHRPKSLDDIKSIDRLNNAYKMLLQNNDKQTLSHLCLCGQNGSSKKTFVYILFKTIYKVHEIKKVPHQFNNGRFVLVGPNYLELNAEFFEEECHQQDLLNYFQILISCHRQIPTFVFIKNAHCLSLDFQKKMKFYFQFNQHITFVFTLTSLIKLKKSIQSNVLVIRFPAPKKTEISNIFDQILTLENLLMYKQHKEFEKLLNCNNLTIAIMQLQFLCHFSTEKICFDKKDFMKKIGDKITHSKDNVTLMQDVIPMFDRLYTIGYDIKDILLILLNHFLPKTKKSNMLIKYCADIQEKKISSQLEFSSNLLEFSAIIQHALMSSPLET